ncbi:ABC transporter permease [Dactylosporangium sp. CA-092794]|uniref:ABC transporter permease n=1 Tax=Dactylosporangium sp. CA-092794 TaxID=3239929 RepID=UPI003D8CC55F
MFGLLFGALRARWAQALVMLALAAVTVVAAGVAARAAGPAGRDAGRARIAGATVAERTLRVRGTVPPTVRPDDALGRIRDLTAAPVEATSEAIRLPGSLVAASGDRRQDAELRAAGALCANATVRQGRCPAGDGEAVLGEELARQLGAGIGDTVTHKGGLTATATPLRIVGIIAPADPAGWFWAGQDGAAAYTTAATVAAARATVTVTYDALLRPEAFDDAGALRAGLDRLQAAGFDVSSGAPALADTVAADRRAVRRGITLGEAQILLFGALAIAVAGAYAAQQRRADAARLAIRGLPRWRIRAATAGQSLLPLAAGAAWSPRLFAAGAVIVAATDWSATRGGVAELMRDVPPRRPLAAATAEVCALGLAVAALFQLLAAPAADVRRDTGFGLAQAAALLVAAGLGVLATRLLLAGATLAGRAALGAGRLSAALAGLTLGRRRTAFRIVPLLAAATCLLGLAAQDWAGAAAARADRAGVELGADRVLRVAPVDRERLLAAVRAADPGGRSAMAVVVTGPPGGPAVVAADTTRLRAVAGVDGAALHPPAPPPLTVTGPSLRLRASGAGARVRLLLIAAGTGAPAAAEFGPLTGEPADYTATVPACARGCRLAAVDADHGPVDLLDLSSDGHPVAAGPVLADPARWRTTVARAASGIQVAQGDGRLRIADAPPTTGDRTVDSRLYVVDTPVPLPALAAGGAGQDDVHDQPAASVFGVTVPIRPLPAATVPRGGGQGLLVDLEYAARIAAATDVTVPAAEHAEVWLAPGAGAAVVARLRAAGLDVTGSDTAGAATARAARLAPAVTLLGDLAVAGVVAVLATIAAFVVAAADRRDRDADLAALRRQGLPAALAGRVERRAALAPVLVAVLTGLVAAALLRALAPPPVRPFADAWPLHPSALQPLALLAAGAAALLLFASVALLRPRRRCGPPRPDGRGGPGVAGDGGAEVGR